MRSVLSLEKTKKMKTVKRRKFLTLNILRKSKKELSWSKRSGWKTRLVNTRRNSMRIAKFKFKQLGFWGFGVLRHLQFKSDDSPIRLEQVIEEIKNPKKKEKTNM
jgi:hypothetical protein